MPIEFVDSAIQGTLVMYGFPYDPAKNGANAIKLLELTADYTETSLANWNQYKAKSIQYTASSGNPVGSPPADSLEKLRATVAANPLRARAY